MTDVLNLCATTNGRSFHGREPGTLLLSEMKCDQKSVAMRFDFRPKETGLRVADKDGTVVTFRVYRAVDFKYKLRKLHRDGNRNIALKIRAAK